jgi:tetratricopeptide (TPR) repeat protein
LLDDPYGEAEALDRLVIAYQGLGLLERAEASQRRALAIVIDIGMQSSLCIILNDLGHTLRVAGKNTEAAMLHKRSLDRAEAMGERPELARAHEGLGDADPAAAREHWLAALELYEGMGMPERHAVAHKLAALDQGQLTHSSVPSANT